MTFQPNTRVACVCCRAGLRCCLCTLTCLSHARDTVMMISLCWSSCSRQPKTGLADLMMRSSMQRWRSSTDSFPTRFAEVYGSFRKYSMPTDETQQHIRAYPHLRSVLVLCRPCNLIQTKAPFKSSRTSWISYSDVALRNWLNVIRLSFLLELL